MERIGQIVNTHGIKGELKIKSSSDFVNERFSKGSKIFIKFDNKLVEHEIQSFRIHKNFPLITLLNLNDINLVLKYKNCIVFQELIDVTLEEDEYLFSDLIGKNVVNDDGLHVGEVVDVLQYPAQDLLVIKTNQKEVLVPFVSEIVIEVSDNVVIKPIEGLL